MVSQFLVSLGVHWLVILMIALSFHTIYQTTKFFHIAHAVVITLGAYMSLLLLHYVGLPALAALPLAVTGVVVIGLLMELGIYRPLRNKGIDSWYLLIASLGLYVVLQNLISLSFGDDVKSIRTGSIKVGHSILGAYITDIQIITIVVSLGLFIGLLLFMKYSSMGKAIKAVASNPELSNIYGINTNRVIRWSFMIGSAMAAIVGILIAYDTDMTPTMGFHVFLYGVVAMIIGGVGSYRGLIAGALLLATAQHLTAWYLDSKWMEAIAYVILIAFLLWKPLGFSGKHLKKVEL